MWEFCYKYMHTSPTLQKVEQPAFFKPRHVPDFILKVGLFLEGIWTFSFTNFSKEAENRQSNLLLGKCRPLYIFSENLIT